VYRKIDIARIDLYHEIENSYLRIYEQADAPTIDIATARWDGKILSFVINDLIPHIKLSKTKEWNIKQTSYWISVIRSALKNASISGIKFNKAFCYILLYMTLDAPWDIDNRCYKFIINGIRYAQLVNDDSYKDIELFISGDTVKDNPRTELYITESSNIKPYIDRYFSKTPQ
jgi:hypothetical protein